MKGRIVGVNVIVKNFGFYFGCCLNNVLLKKYFPIFSLPVGKGEDLANQGIRR